ncbi:putative O-linked N-acetylglucosamine transferase (SPINDLY family) [Skermanella aerolata]|uniref:O-linked N-acetylglucosamine transferase, SPINDLY family protein n=1 Tax=Skermanella aerolata TaxID=393310 RepID=UPI003D1FBDCA
MTDNRTNSIRNTAARANELLRAAREDHSGGRFALAEQGYHEALQADPLSADALNGLAALALVAGAYGRTVELTRRALCSDPVFFKALCNLGGACHALGLIDEARAVLQRALAVVPGHIESLNNLALIEMSVGHTAKAVALLKEVTADGPDNPLFLKNLGAAYIADNQYETAVNILRRAAHLASSNPEILNNLGMALTMSGQTGNGIELLRRAIALNPGYLEARSNLLFMLQHIWGVDPENIFREQAAYNSQVTRGMARPASRSPVPTGSCRLRLGYVSRDLGFHPVGHLLLPVLEAHDRERLEIYCYSDRLIEDELTARLQACTDVWRRTSSLDDEALAETVRADGIDILFDLGGHTAGNRLGAFAMRPAPVQISWLGYVGGTGLEAMDFTVLDHMIAPTEGGWRTSERVLRMPGTFLCYRPPDFAPPVEPPPSLRNGFVTFGSFNRPVKVGAEVLRTWSGILRAVPDSRLVLKSACYKEDKARNKLLSAFSRHGIDPARIEIRAGSSHTDMLRQYADIDIALDPFPFSGGITSCEALWMGVPVVTLAGATPVSRMTFSFLTEIDLEEFAATEPESYIEVARYLAQDQDVRLELRESLRERMTKSHLGDARAFTAAFETLIAEAWQWSNRRGDGMKTGVPSRERL